MKSLRLAIPLLCFLPVVVPAADTAPDPSANVITQVKAWLKMPRDKRPEIPEAVAKASLSKAAAAELSKVFWEDHAAMVKATRSEGYIPAEPAASAFASLGKTKNAADIKANVIQAGGKDMKYKAVNFGGKPGTLPLFISMHGGGGAPQELNDSQWVNQIRLGKEYHPSAGIYVAPRAPTNSWNLWHEGHIDALFDRLIQDMIVLEGVDPNKVYIMGYSAGGDGVYQLAPRMADYLAAASMMAGHPNGVSMLGVRNIGFTIHVGAKDGAYNRNDEATKYGKILDDLQKSDPKGYVHFEKLHEGREHWMNMEDKEAIPWMEKFTRNPFPEKIVWHQSSRVHERFYWLAVPKAEAKGNQDIVAERSGQNITITAKSNPHVSVRLNDTILDLDQPVTVTFNGTALPAKKVERTVDVIRRTIEERGDPDSIFSAEITVP